MDYIQFVTKVRDIGNVIKDPTSWEDESLKKNIIYTNWELSRKSSWGNSDDQEDESDFEDLDKVLEEFWPNITLLEYRKLCRELIKKSEYTDSDYYSTTKYGIKLVYLEDLYKYLEEKGIL